MDLPNIFSFISAPFDLVKSIGMGIIDLIGRGHPDQAKLAEMKNQYELAVKNLDFSIQQAQILLAEKMMVGAKWQYPLSMVTGIAIVCACFFNLIMKSFGCNITLDILTPEWLILLGMFLYVTSGSSEILVKIAIWIISKIPDKSKNTTNNQ